MSRLVNCIDPRQGHAKKVLTVCWGNQLRSPTAAIVLSGAPFHFNTRSCGLDPGSAVCLIDDTMVNWADEIVTMEPKHTDMVKAMPGYRGQKITCLNLEDKYNFRDPELSRLIMQGYMDEN